ncbi:hypothetical protein DYU11_22660 [Fibrisoma montanum]|uniref:Uncharacterized protein n=1 Tax=Fibrisoma montanum TaxID=2305895 RepID=A0A418M246_9BACT|nr:hypothetical protein [Fibrisoma montanum]RIV19734.1 hypothetical protein DYU11_22660 [Fibrisoma montanum]
MPFEKGKPRPTAAGRKEGTPNKATEVHRAFWQDIVNQQAGRITTALNAVYKEDKAEFLKIVMSMTEFVMPKLARTEITGAKGERIKVTLDLGGSFMATAGADDAGEDEDDDLTDGD